jgi:ssDNA-binding Zn-finger/Zn-ribbon topoisomerase 1
MINTKCPNCGFEKKIEKEHYGKKYKCPDCNNIIQVNSKFNLKKYRLTFLISILLILILGVIYRKPISNLFLKNNIEVYIPYLKLNNKYVLVKEKELIPVNEKEYDFIRIKKDPITNIIYYTTEVNYNNSISYGVINSKGVEVIEPICVEDINFYNSLAAIRKNDSYSLISLNDFKEISNLQYEAVSNFYGSNLIGVKSDSQKKYINYSGELVFKKNYEDIDQISPKLFTIKKDSKWGIIDEKENLLIETKYDEPITLTPLNDGFIVKKNGNKFYIDFNDSYLRDFPTNYNIGDTSWGPFSNGLIKIQIRKSYGYNTAYIDSATRKIIVPFGYDYLGYFQEGFAKIEIKNKCGFVNINGDLTIPPSFDNTSEFSDSLCAVLIGDKFGFIDYAGNLKIPTNISVPLKFIAYPGRYQLPRFENNYCVIESSVGKFGVIDKNGKQIIDQIYDYVSGFDQFGLSQVKLNDKYFYINSKGIEFRDR